MKNHKAVEPIDTLSDWQYEGVRGYDRLEDMEKKIEILAERLNEVIGVVNSLLRTYEKPNTGGVD